MYLQHTFGKVQTGIYPSLQSVTPLVVCIYVCLLCGGNDAINICDITILIQCSSYKGSEHYSLSSESSSSIAEKSAPPTPTMTTDIG